VTKQEAISYTEQDGKKGRAQEIDQVIGGQLRKMRKMRNLTQEDLADRLGVSFQQIQKYENGKNRIPFGRAYELSHFLGVDMEAFTNDASGGLGLSDNSQQALEGYNKEQSQREIEELQKAYFSINDPGRRSSFVKLVKDMAKNIHD
jgi:transcriptional regulator with XRE-family HTH domain